MVCCGLFQQDLGDFVPPKSKRFVPPVQKIVPKKDNSFKPGKSGEVGIDFQNKFNESDENKVKLFEGVASQNNKFTPRQNRETEFIPQNLISFIPQNRCPPSKVNNFSQPTTPAMFYYAPRMKSIRVSSPPNIEGWERSIREEMRLKGRSRQTVNRLLARIQKYYDDPTIEASDYAPGNAGYQPSSESRELAETRIRRTVESMVEFFTKSKNLNMDESQSSNGSSMLKGKLTFINTQLDKLGKERVGMDELREIVAMKLNPAPVQAINNDKDDLKDVGLNQVLPGPQIAEMVPQPKDILDQIDLALPNFDKEKIVESNVESLYESFATWLVDNDKIFPSLDPEVDARTLRYFDRINGQLRELGKFENMQIFREKTLAHLDEILDDRGQLQQPLDRASELLVPEDDDDPLFRGESRAPGYVHLASLPGKVIPSSNTKKLELSLPGSKVQPFDSLGNKRVFRVMDNLPGQIVY
tara:strand:+ start:4886 stop:6298 length:1413 start_codon:yes stop_codon:yes gene_type:complete